MQSENNTTIVSFDTTLQEVLEKIMETVTEMEHCPYETTVSLLLTDNAGIRIYNRQYREIDRETDKRHSDPRDDRSFAGTVSHL